MTKAGAELAAVAVLLAVSAAGLAGDAARPHLIYLHGRIVQEEQGLSHGFLYRPIPEWVDPVVDWAGAR